MTKILSVAIVVIFLIASPVRLLASSAYAAAEDESKDAPFYLRSSIDFNRDNDEADNTYNNNNNVVDVVTKPSNDLEQQEQQQDERELLFWNRCANGRRTPYCVCQENELRAEIGNASTDRDDPTRIRICLGQGMLFLIFFFRTTGQSKHLNVFHIDFSCPFINSTLFVRTTC